MSVNPGGTGVQSPVQWANLTPAGVEALREAYLATYRGPHGDAPDTDADSADTGALQRIDADEVVPTELMAAHYRLGQRRPHGEIGVAVRDDDATGFGPALQVVTDHAGLQMDSLPVLLHRLGVAYVAIMNPVLRVQRNNTGDIVRARATAGRRRPRQRVDGDVDPRATDTLSRSQGPGRGGTTAAERAG